MSTKKIVFTKHCSGNPFYRAEVPGDAIEIATEQANELIDAGVALDEESYKELYGEATASTEGDKALTAPELVKLIESCTDVEKLKSLIEEGEKRKTVLAAYEAQLKKLSADEPSLLEKIAAATTVDEVEALVPVDNTDTAIAEAAQAKITSLNAG